jgi:hypothetical protein
VNRGTTAVALAAESAARRILPPTDGIGVPSPLLDQVVVEQPDDDQALLESGVRQPYAGVEGYATTVNIKGDSYRLKEKAGLLGRKPRSAEPEEVSVAG